MYSIHSYRSIYNTIVMGDFFLCIVFAARYRSKYNITPSLWGTFYLCIVSIATDQHTTHEKGDFFYV